VEEKGSKDERRHKGRWRVEEKGSKDERGMKECGESEWKRREARTKGVGEDEDRQRLETKLNIFHFFQSLPKRI